MFVYVGYPRRPTAPTPLVSASHDGWVAGPRRAFGVARYFTQRSLCLSLLIVALTTQQGAWCWPASALRPCPEVPGLADDVGCGNRHERSTGEEDVGRSTGDGKRGSSRRDLQDVPGDACARRGELQAKTAVHGSERRGAEALQGEDRDTIRRGGDVATGLVRRCAGDLDRGLQRRAGQQGQVARLIRLGEATQSSQQAAQAREAQREVKRRGAPKRVGDLDGGDCRRSVA